MRAPKKPLRVAAALALALVLSDVALTLTVVGDGLFQGWPLPPFHALTHPEQRGWLTALRSGEEADGIGRFDAELGWSWRPSSASPDGRSTTNALGARGPREYAREKPDGVLRLACFGDSFTFCDEGLDSWAWPWIVEQHRRDVEALNFGVSGYGTDQALLRFRRVAPGLDADVVCIGVLLENIGRNVNRYRPLWNVRTGFCATKPRFTLAADGALTLLPQPYATRAALLDAIESDALPGAVAEGEHWYQRPRVPTGRWSAFGRLLGGVRAQRARDPRRLWLDAEGEPRRVTLALLEAFHDEALASGARAAPVIVFPPREALYAFAAGGPRWWSNGIEELERRGVAVIDVAPALAQRHRESEADPGRGSVYYGAHLSSVGNSVVASELLSWLRENGFAPSASPR